MFLKKPNCSSTKTLLSSPKFISSQAVSATKEQEKQADKFKSNIPCPSDSQHSGSEEQLIDLSNPFFIISRIFSGSPCETKPPILPSDPSAVYINTPDMFLSGLVEMYSLSFKLAVG